MQQILTYFWRICLLRAGPERIPGNLFVLGFTFAAYFALSLVTKLITDSVTVPVTVAALLIGVAVDAAVLYGLLLFKQVQYRFIPTLAALLGTTAVILLIMLPANVLFDNVDTPTMRAVAGILFLSAFVWRLAISGSILSKAARISLLQGAAIMFGMEMITLSIRSSLLPSAGG